jgi:hypothetical protein
VKQAGLLAAKSYYKRKRVETKQELMALDYYLNNHNRIRFISNDLENGDGELSRLIGIGKELFRMERFEMSPSVKRRKKNGFSFIMHVYTCMYYVYHYTHICVYIYICSGIHTHTCTLRPTEKEKRKRGRGRNLLTLSSTERKFVFISNLAIVQNNDSVVCEYCKHIAKVSQP